MQEGERKKAIGSGLKNFNTALAVGTDQRVEDIMPAQQSNLSAEMLEYDEGRTQEIPRQSVLSNLVESSISNFENEESVEDGATGAGEIDAAVNQKSQIRIERQSSISKNHKIYKNLKSRKSRKEGKRKNEPSI